MNHLQPMTRHLAALLLCLLCGSHVAAQTYEQLIERALGAASHDSLPQAEQLFRQALKASPNDYRNALVFSNLGKIQERQYWQDPRQTKKAEEAIESYTLALNITPEAIPLIQDRATLYMRLEQWGKAVMDLTTILDLTPDNTDMRNYRAYCYHKQRLFTEARTDYTRILEHQPDHRLALLGMAMLEHDTGHLSEALQRITLMVEASPTDAELYSIRSGMYAENKQAELAIIDLDRAILLDSKNTNYLLARAYLHLQQGNRRLALTDFEQAIALGVPRASLKKELKACR